MQTTIGVPMQIHTCMQIHAEVGMHSVPCRCMQSACMQIQHWLLTSLLACSSFVLERPFFNRSSRFSICATSANASSKLIVSASSAGSTFPLTWCTSASSKHRTTCRQSQLTLSGREQHICLQTCLCQQFKSDAAEFAQLLGKTGTVPAFCSTAW